MSEEFFSLGEREGIVAEGLSERVLIIVVHLIFFFKYVVWCSKQNYLIMNNVTDYQKGKVLFVFFLLIPPILASVPLCSLVVDFLSSQGVEVGTSLFAATKIVVVSTLTILGVMFMMTLPYVLVIHFWSLCTGKKEFGAKTIYDGFGHVYMVFSHVGALL